MTDFSFSLQDSELRFNFTEFVPTLIEVERGADSEWVNAQIASQTHLDSEWVLSVANPQVDSDFVQDTIDSDIDFLYEKTLEANDFNDFQTTVRKLRASRYIYAFTASDSVVEESDSFSITCYVPDGAPDGLVVPYNITGVSSDDIDGASLTGSFILNSDSDTITFETTRDANDSETFTLTLDHYHQNVSVNVLIEDNPPEPSGSPTFFPLSGATDPTSSTNLAWRNNNVGYTFVPYEGITTVSTMTFGDGMFYENGTFNDSELLNWDVSQVETINSMFLDAVLFNQPIGNWDTSSVTSTQQVFYGAEIFNQPLNNWNVSNVTDMSGMFREGLAFNQPLNNWNVSNVMNMSSMFNGATNFNQDISGWDTSSVTDMNSMFRNATNLSQDISGWNVDNVTIATNFARDSGLDSDQCPSNTLLGNFFYL